MSPFGVDNPETGEYKEMEQVISSAEAAKRLGIDKSTLHRWVRAGRIKPIERLPSGYLRFNLSEVDRVKRSFRVK